MAWWMYTIIILAVTGIIYFVLYRSMKKRQAEFEKMYRAHKEVREIFVLHKKMVKQPIRPNLKFPKVKTYQVTARVTFNQTTRGASFTAQQNVTFMIDKKEYEKVQPNRKYKVELSGNYIGKVFPGKKVG
ncbi:hypothetical protein [Ammoniphilus sp. YIM 78166]|uniref:hypothetical protein n=1 Tax=Ammoniphilus sp. YIM 78166 TaxID=1644106 RepID=UPI00106F147A|nr:hypothetical protein [Ammoniphilus sp. YIM 78166]